MGITFFPKTIMRSRLYTFFLCLITLFAGCTRGLWLDEIVAQRDEQEEVVPILEAAQEKGLTVDSVEEIERTNKYYTVDTANGYYNEFKRYRLVFSDQTTVEFDVLGTLNGVQSDYYAERGLSYISEVQLSGSYVSVMLVDPTNGVVDGFVFLNTSPNAPQKGKIYYTSTDGGVVTPYDTNAFGANIVSNTYENGQGVITFDSSVTSIGWGAFRDRSSLASITIPDSVTEIGNYAFEYCSSLASITIPNNVTSIGEWAFSGCSSLTSITIPDGVTSIGYYAFRRCSSLAEVYCKAITPPTAIPNSSSRWDAFDDNASDRKIYVPAESVEAYKTAEWWSEYADAFVPYDFEKGEDVNMENRIIYYTSTDGNVVTPSYSAFGANIVSNTYENGQGVITFDGEVTSIGVDAFWGCSTLASVTIPEGVTSIGYWAFAYCSSLASVTIPDGVTSIEGCAFYKCTSLTSITIPEGVTSIGESAFRDCSGLANITIPEGVTSIGNYAFSGCSSLASVTIPDSITSIGNEAFFGCSSLASITIPEGVTSIGRDAFNGCSSLTSITIPDSVTSIGQGAFYNCSSLASVTIPDSVTSIGTSAFYNCSSLASVTIPDSVTSIGGGAFWGCSSLASVTIPDSVTSIGVGAFSGCTSLASITIPDSVTSIGGSAFMDCSSLASITIPDGVTSIGDYAFYNCTSLASVYCKPTTPPSGDSAMFNSNGWGRKIYVPEESVEAYKTAEWWSEYADDIVGYSF